MTNMRFDDLNGKVCVLTGGGGVIGTALAKGFGMVGLKLAILDIRKEFADNSASQVHQETNATAIGVEANVLEQQSLENALSVIHKELGTIDILINCAGGNSPKATTQFEFLEPKLVGDIKKSFYGLNIEGFRKVFDLNFIGTLLPTMIFTKDMVDQGGGVVLNISSMSSYRPLTKIPAYSAAKSSINSFTEWLAVHLAKVNIRVNGIAPGFFLTMQNKFLLIDEKTNDLTARGQKIISNTPMGRFGDPEELQGTALYLISDQSKFVTGIIVPVDGGFNAYSGV